MSILSTDEQPKRMSKKIETTYFTQRERSGKIKKKEQRGHAFIALQIKDIEI